MSLENLFSDIWKQYTELNPDAFRIHSLLEDSGEQVLNDHIAYRTLNHPELGIGRIAKVFKDFGYEERGEYFFKAKKLYAIHMENAKDPTQPKIFISELELEKVSEELQDEMNQIVLQIPKEKLEGNECCTLGRLWEASHSTYQKLYKESEYAAWFYAYGFCANHFTVNLNALKNFNEISELNQFLMEKGFQMNDSGGLVKGSPTDYLEQSSTMAFQKEVDFSDGNFQVPSCYYEFAKRYPLNDGKLYQGFVAQSADKIFESTNQRS